MGEKPARAKQIIGAFGACMGAFSLGNAIGWSSPALETLTKTYKASQTDIMWLVSSMTFAAAFSQVTSAMCVTWIGPKWTLLIATIPVSIGWCVMAFGDSILCFYIGRVLTGFGGGTYSVASPVYIGEISDKDIRGALGALYQLLLVGGVLYTFVLGEFHNMYWLTLPHLVFPVALIMMILFLPDTPVYLFKRGKQEKARQSLQKFRGKHYDIEVEIKAIEEYARPKDESFWSALRRKANLKAFSQLLLLHIIQQLSGIKSVMFYAFDIFSAAGGDLSEGISTIILGTVQILMTGLAVYTVDKVGRRPLWLISLSLMSVCHMILGIYFFVKASYPDVAAKVTFIPIISVSLYICSYAVGAGPLPWVMIGEMLDSRIKGPAAAVIAFTNWMSAFVVAMAFPVLLHNLGSGMVYWIFAAICASGIPFVLLVLIETKGKNLQQIQMELSGVR